MGFDYQKLKRKQGDDGSFWTSYSDLFMVLSVVFLLLYVVASMRSGTNSVQQKIENIQLSNQVQDLKKQLQAYNTLKDDYLEKQASEEESEMYDELMDKLSLLQDDAQKEADILMQKARENEKKKQALNKYQQMVRNIVNTNLLSNKKIKTRNEIIEKKNDAIAEMDETIQEQTADIRQKSQIINKNLEQIEEQEKEIAEKQQALEEKRQQVTELEGEIAEKTETIEMNQSKINQLNSNLNKKIKELEKTYTTANKSKAELSKKIALMKLDNAKKIKELNDQTKTMQDKVNTMNVQLADASDQIEDAKSRMAEQEAIKAQLEADIKNANEEYQRQMSQMKSDFENKIAGERAALEAKLNREKASASEKLKQLNAFKEKVAAEKATLDGELSKLKGEVENTKDQLGKATKEAGEYKEKLAAAKEDHGRYLAAIGKLQKEKEGLSGDLKRAQEIANAKKKLAADINAALKSKGIKADVDGKTGDVIINFGDEYFDTGRADLKTNMKDVLKKFIPTYSQTLLSDQNIAKEISSVEIIGFSSPTYKGKYIDPSSLDENDRAAIEYNLDLSYQRAKSIFGYIFDKKSMTYQKQKDLLPLVKVTGRSYLAEEIKGRDIASGINHKEYCKKFDCKKSQKVLIKFNLKD
jgi:hypothetical protein